MAAGEMAGRLPSWSCGGEDGRSLLDRFLDGLPAHLASRGRAVITHNGFVGLDRTRALAEANGLTLRTAMTVLVYMSADKLELMTPGILAAETGRSIHRYGPYAFADMHIVELARPGSLGG
jgi:hypothetical protein